MKKPAKEKRYPKTDAELATWIERLGNSVTIKPMKGCKYTKDELRERAEEARSAYRRAAEIIRSTTKGKKTGLRFGQAIDACRYRGAKIQRVNWNGEGQFVRFEEVLASEDGKLHDNPENAVGMVVSRCFVFHFVNRKTGETGIQVGWLASQADMAASDWRIVE